MSSVGGKRKVDENDPEDAPYLVPKKLRRQKFAKRKTPVLTRSKLAINHFRQKKAPISAEQRANQKKVYQNMPKETETDFKALQAQGKPCHKELETTAVMPDIHKQAAFVRKSVQAGEGGASQVIFKYDQIRKKHAVFALVKESLKYHSLIDQLLEDVKLQETYPGLKDNKELVHVLVYDLLFGKGLDYAWPHAALSAVLAAHQQLLQALYKNSFDNPAHLLPFKGLPRYARVNTIKADLQEIILSFKSSGYTLRDNILPAQYPHLKPKEFCVDPDVPNLLVFAPETTLAGGEHDNYKIVLQDKASCFSALALLDPDRTTEPSGVMDACAAPGNKTLHLAALLHQTQASNRRSSEKNIPLIAVEKDVTRFKSLKNRIYKAYAKVQCINSDFLALDPFDTRFENVTHMLVDPSCSGSGIVSPERLAFSTKKPATRSTNKQTTAASSKFVCLPDSYEELEYDDPNPDYNFEEAPPEASLTMRNMLLNGFESDESGDDQYEDTSDTDEESDDEGPPVTKVDVQKSKPSKKHNEEDEAQSNEKELSEVTAAIENTEDFNQYSVHNIDTQSVERVKSLHNFQVSVILHALKFPAVQRVVYSTCSVYIEENEHVVEEILKLSPKFRLVRALPNWNTRGLKTFEEGPLCARASPQTDAATGFFVACFERKEKPDSYFNSKPYTQSATSTTEAHEPTSASATTKPNTNPTNIDPRNASGTSKKAKKKRRATPAPIVTIKE